MKNTKRSMLMSGLCLLLTAVMLMGSTFAWFTDSVTNEGNTIQSGTLDVALNNGTETALFASDDTFKWEPGRSQMAEVTVSNAGSLWLKYTMSFANVKVTDSKANSNADITAVLDVYKVDKSKGNVKAEDLDVSGNYLGTMKDLMAAGQLDEAGVLAPENATNMDSYSTSETFTLVIKMKESADNRYQGCGVEFDVVVNATQYNHEQDGFGSSDYDKDVVYLPDEVQAMAADLDVVSDAGAGPVNDALILQYGNKWLSEKGVSIAYVAGFKDGQFVVRAKPTTKVEANLIYVVMNVRNESGTTEKVGEWDNPAWGGNSGNANSDKGAVKALSDGWYEYSCNTYGLGEEVGYTISVGYKRDDGGNNGEAYVKNGTGWNWADYIHVENETNHSNTVEDTGSAEANGEALKAALTVATAGDTILLKAGEFTLPAGTSIPAGVTVVGSGVEETKITVPKTTSGNYTMGLIIDQPGITIQNATINPVWGITNNNFAGVIVVKEGDTVLDNVVITSANSASPILVTGSGFGVGDTLTIRNSTISCQSRGVYIVDSTNGKVIMDNCDITGVYPFNVNSGNSQNLEIEVRDSALHGWSSYGHIKSASFSNTEFSQGSSDYNFLRPYTSTTWTGCTFGEGFKIGAGAEGLTYTFTDCVYADGEPVTAENIGSELLDPTGTDACLLKCTITVDGTQVVLD